MGEENAKVVESCAGALVSIYKSFAQMSYANLCCRVAPAPQVCNGARRRIVNMLVFDFNLRPPETVQTESGVTTSTYSSRGLGE